ncbi:GntR family transcriptional regulator [Virgibacillus chiguensis]|uniref:GntR family transcriptional regulator n=1 Tax=Virgibacillus chiguensis TaxID=411959 RepID=A0A1M5RPL4_9BACI|nr:GntR family transcriptional regulator [Virgibacillus chiguensis]SHH28048.1 GntR family transcriptional regulator [Virgibacillus chiguensis]
MLNKNDVIPLYVQLKDVLRGEIMSGKLKDNDALPSESQLMKNYSITRTTIRRAIDELVQEGLVERVHGKGVFVRLRQTRHTVWNFQSFTEYAFGKSQYPITKVLEQKVIKESNNRMLHLTRLRGVKTNRTISWLTIDTSIIPLSLFPGLEQYDFEENSLYELFRQQYKLYPHHVDIEIVPITCDHWTHKQLQLNNYDPLLQSKGSVYTENGTKIEDINIIYGPKFQFKLNQYI